MCDFHILKRSPGPALGRQSNGKARLSISQKQVRSVTVQLIKRKSASPACRAVGLHRCPANIPPWRTHTIAAQAMPPTPSPPLVWPDLLLWMPCRNACLLATSSPPPRFPTFPFTRPPLHSRFRARPLLRPFSSVHLASPFLPLSPPPPPLLPRRPLSRLRPDCELATASCQRRRQQQQHKQQQHAPQTSSGMLAFLLARGSYGPLAFAAR